MAFSSQFGTLGVPTGPRTRALIKVKVGPRRLGSLESSASQEGVSLGSWVRGPRWGQHRGKAWSPRASAPNSKDGQREVVFKPHPSYQ